MSHGMNDFAIDPWWQAVKARLGSGTMTTILGASGRVYVAGLDDFEEAEGPQSVDWGRVVIVPVDTLWPQVERPGETTPLAWLVRTEVNDLVAPNYRPFVALEAAQREAYRLLSSWLPDAGAISGLRVAVPVYRYARPQPTAQRDGDRALFYLSAEYRTEVAGLAPVVT